MFPASHPLHQILTKLARIDEDNAERWKQEFTFDWDLYLANLLVKITSSLLASALIASLSIYHSQKALPTPYIGLHTSPIVLQFQFYSIVAVAALPFSHR